METSGKFALTVEDAVAGMRLFAWSGMTSRKAIVYWLMLYLIVVAVVSWAFVAGASEPGKLLANAPKVLGASLLPFVLLLVVTVISVPVQARRTHRQQRSLQGEMTLAWSPEALHIQSEYGAFAMPWSHFLRWREDARSILLYESERLIRIVPKRVLDDAQQQSFRACLANIDKHAKRDNGKQP